jgi:hypothetical protein
MEIKIYFSIISHDGVDIGIAATATLSGKRIEATFHHDIEDDRECLVDKIEFFNEDGDEFSGSEKLIEIVHEHVYDNDINIYKDAEKGGYIFYIDNFKSDNDYSALML